MLLSPGLILGQDACKLFYENVELIKTNIPCGRIWSFIYFYFREIFLLQRLLLFSQFVFSASKQTYLSLVTIIRLGESEDTSKNTNDII